VLEVSIEFAAAWQARKAVSIPAARKETAVEEEGKIQDLRM
jgi:hypothetical protein